MFDQFVSFYFNYLNSLLFAGVSLIGLYGGYLLIGRTQSKGPLLVVISCLAKVLVGVAVPITVFLSEQTFLFFDDMDYLLAGSHFPRPDWICPPLRRSRYDCERFSFPSRRSKA